MKSTKQTPPRSRGVRKLRIEDQAPRCEVLINELPYALADLVAGGRRVVDIGCGHGRNRALVEQNGGEWVGVEPFEGGAHTVVASAEDLPFEDASFDVAIMDAVLEHIPDVGKAFAELGRVLKPGGQFVGYVAFMECFHEISYSHLSYKALEHYAELNGMELKRVSGGGRFGIDYQLAVLWSPLPVWRGGIAWGIRTVMRAKALAAFFALRWVRRMPRSEAKSLARLFYQVECLRQSAGFHFVIEKQP